VLLRRSVFIAAGADTWRFVHREFEDYFVARYLATCVRFQYVDELRHRAYTAPIYGAAAAMLSDYEYTKPAAEHVLARSKKLQDQFIIGNMGALFGDSCILLEDAALALTLRGLREFPAAARLTTLLDWGFRAVRNHPDDPCSDGIERALSNAFDRHDFIPEGAEGNSVLKSAIWCFRREFASTGSAQTTQNDWPELNQSTEDDAVLIIASNINGELTAGEKQQSVQIGFAKIQKMVLQSPAQAIATMHFLFPICVAYAKGVATRLVRQELLSLISPNSGVGAALDRYPHNPEVKKVLQNIWKAAARLVKRGA
jgi:hypothetical protein